MVIQIKDIGNTKNYIMNSNFPSIKRSEFIYIGLQTIDLSKKESGICSDFIFSKLSQRRKLASKLCKRINPPRGEFSPKSDTTYP